MLFERFEDDDLSQYSYMVGCPAAGEVAVVDPRRDVEVYLRHAEEAGVEIRHVLETHIHADFASGARELAEATGARLALSVFDEGETYEVAFPHEEIGDGESFDMGSVRIQALHTPGHTPEHLSFLVYDLNRSEEVAELLLSGDFLFVGAVGRPDLLGEEAKRELAERLYESVTGVLPTLPDGVEVHPGHGSGSMCGAGIGGRSMSTLGYERVANPYLQPMTREEFVDRVLGSVPPFPAYYRRMKQLNADGPPSLRNREPLRMLSITTFADAVEGGAVVVDLRHKEAYAGAHVPESVYVGHRPSMWGGWVVPYDTPLLLVAEDREQAERGRRSLARVGLDGVRGALEGGIEAWEESGRPVGRLEVMSPRELVERRGESLSILDVRGDAPWRSGHIEGALHLVGGTVQEHLDEVPEGPLAVVCNTGFQSTVVASVLERSGRGEVANVAGGMAAWEAAGLPVEREEERAVEV